VKIYQVNDALKFIFVSAMLLAQATCFQKPCKDIFSLKNSGSMRCVENDGQ